MKKLNNLKWFTFGIILTIVVSAFIVPVLASFRQVQATLYYKDINVTLDGVTIVARDANGNIAEPFIIDGTTYLPLRGISNLLGLDVDWDENTNTVILTKPFAPRGNSSANIKSDGYVSVQDDWIYYSIGSGIYAEKVDGSETLKLSDDTATFINVISDRIYYSNHSDNVKIYTMKTDGTDRKKLNDDESTYVTVVGDMIYYLSGINGDHQSSLYVIRTDGSGKQKLTDDIFSISKGFSIYGDYVYYTVVNISGKYFYQSLYSMKTDGSDIRLIEEYADDFDIAGYRIYYRGGTSLYSMKIDGSDKQEINNDDVLYIHIIDDKIYYRLGGGRANLYSVNIDGSNKQKINDDYVQNVCIVGEWIYYTNNDANGDIYRVKTDGSNKQAVLK